MEPHYAPEEKASKEQLQSEIEIVSQSPVVDGLLHSISGLLAVLNDKRQVVSLNYSLTKMLGIQDPDAAFGLRPGEAFECKHALDEPQECGGTRYCSTCGAAIAIVTSLGENRPVERICALEAKRGDNMVDIALVVRSHPILIEKRKFLLLFFQDITRSQQRAALERTFFHDVNNLMIGLVGASEMLATEADNPQLAQAIHQSALRLKNEISIQSCLSQSESYSYQPLHNEVTTEQVLNELHSFFANHPVARNKKIEISYTHPSISMNTDLSLLLRVLCNMVTNALEATQENGAVKIWLEQKKRSLTFCVWNDQAIPKNITLRIFQRNFSTKHEPGRGIGTYSMKLFGEKILNGKVTFSTSKQKGTVFKFNLPL